MKRALLLWLGGCAVTVSAADNTKLSAGDMLAARQTYVTKCAKCHRLYEPNDYSEPEWQRWMDAMRRKSRLKPGQGDLLLRYLDAYRAGQLSGKPADPPKP